MRKSLIEPTGASLVVVFVLMLVASCSQTSTGFDCHAAAVDTVEETSNPARSDLAGVWLTAPEYDDVKMTLNADGTFAWENRSVPICDSGTWTADETTLTFAFAKDDPFCTGETLTWEYEVEGDRLISEGVANTCSGERRVEKGSSWEFERQADG